MTDDDLDDLAAAYVNDHRSHLHGGPWVALNMINSLDGAIAIDGLSGGLGNEADLAVFKALRSIADVVLVAAGTARAEGYRPPSISDDALARRRAAGQRDRPVIAVVTRSLSLDIDSDLFADPDYRPVVVTVADAPADLRERLATRAEIVVAGHGDVDLDRAVHQLAELHGSMVLAEGGPSLNGQLAAADLFDEVCVTTAPVVVGGGGPRIIGTGGDHEPRPFAIDRVRTARGLLFTRYLRSR